MRPHRSIALTGVALLLAAVTAWAQTDTMRTGSGATTTPGSRARGSSPGTGTTRATPSASSRAAAVSRGAAAGDAMVILPADSVRWGDAPNALPPGARFAVLDGNPEKEGVFTLRVHMPDGYRVPPHWHPTMEHVTVISGRFGIGMGDTFDPARGTVMGAGGFTALPARMHHYAWAEGETVVQVHGTGPFAITYINPSDDPRGTKR